MTVVSIIVLALLLPLVVFDAVARPTIRRLAVGNVARRPGEAALVIGGTLLAGALVTASFVIGDSIGFSIRQLAGDRWGVTDELVVVADPAQVPEVAAGIDRLPSDLVDGTLSLAFLDAAVGSASGDRVEPDLRLVEADPAAAVDYSGDVDLLGDPDRTGLGPSEAVVNQQVADDLGIGVGDDIEVLLTDQTVALEVVSVRPAVGLSSFGEVIVGPGTVTGQLDGADAAAVASGGVLVSNAGDVFTGNELTGDVLFAIESQVGPGVEVQPVKDILLRDAEESSAETTELFGTIGGFSVAAGILLMVNLFVMLASERKTEMGTMRAIGLRRGHLVRALTMEGAIYGLAASLAGLVVGIGVAAGVLALASGLAAEDGGNTLSVEATSLLSGAVIGFAVSQLTVTLTGLRITRLNIVRALRDLPEPSRTGHGRRQLVLGLLGLAGGTALYALAGSTPVVAMLAPVVAVVSLIPFLARLLPRRLAIVAACGAGLAWVAAVFGLLPDVMAEPDILLFLIQGVLLVGLATVILAMLDRVWLAWARKLTGAGIASRIGLAEPLARPVRTALLVAMYALVVFTLTFIAVLNAVFQAQAPEFANQIGGDYDLYVDTNPSSGLTAATLADRDDVLAVAPLQRGELMQLNLPVTGIDQSFLAADPPPLFDRDERFANDADVWAAIAQGEPYLLLDEDLGGDLGLSLGDTYDLPGDGSSQAFTVAGFIEQGWLIDTEFIVGSDHAAEVLGDGRPPTRFYLALADSADPEQVARELTAAHVAEGARAETFLAAVRVETDGQEVFLNLMSAYLGLGLLIGIAGLGVVLVRAVRERRRQFGVMRALGIAAPVVRRTFVIEAAFVATQGVVLGIGLGLLSAWQVMTRSEAFERDLPFAVPVTTLALLAAGCLVASLVTAAAPAIRAGRTTPAAALRLTT